MKAYDRVKLREYPYTKGVILSMDKGKAKIRLFFPIAKIRNVQTEDKELELTKVIKCLDVEFGL